MKRMLGGDVLRVPRVVCGHNGGRLDVPRMSLVY